MEFFPKFKPVAFYFYFFFYYLSIPIYVQDVV